MAVSRQRSISWKKRMPSSAKNSLANNSMNGDLSKLSDADLANLIDQKSAALQGAQPWSSELVKFLTLSVLIFGILVILIMAVLVLKKSSAGEILRLFTVPMVIVAAV